MAQSIRPMPSINYGAVHRTAQFLGHNAHHLMRRGSSDMVQFVRHGAVHQTWHSPPEQRCSSSTVQTHSTRQFVGSVYSVGRSEASGERSPPDVARRSRYSAAQSIRPTNTAQTAWRIRVHTTWRAQCV